MQNQMISLTVSFAALDQSDCQRIEVLQNATLKQAVLDAIPTLKGGGPIDIYDVMGSVISDNNATAHHGSTIYVGFMRIECGCGHLTEI